MSVPDEVRRDAERIGELVRKKLLEIMELQADIDALLRDDHPTPFGAKWYRNYFYFSSTYTCPGPNALSPTFEAKFARMEHLGGGRFALYFMRHTGEWVGLYDALSVDESLKAIRDDSWFVP